jgi:exodeoxyribonuclease VII small subunit
MERDGLEIEDHLVAAETIVRKLENGEMRLAEAISAFREACDHLSAGEQMLVAAKAEVERLVAPGGGTEPLRLPSP